MENWTIVFGEGLESDRVGTMGEQKEFDPLAAKIAQCRPFLREDYESIDSRLPGLLKILHARGAGECWHKHGTFYEHLLHTYRILKLWGSSDTVALFGLFHSSYSNSYVNLAIFAPDVDRSVLRGLIGDEAEELVHIFCVIPRQELIFDRLLHTITDDDLIASLKQYQGTKVGESEANAKGGHDKRRLFVPKEGMVVKHIRTGEDIFLPRRLVALFVLLTMADFVDQFYGWQDQLFRNDDGEFRYSGNDWHALWPGNCKPGLWISIASRMGVLLNILLLEDAAEQAELHSVPNGLPERPFGTLEISLPPIFNMCTEILPPVNQNRSLEQYWEAVNIEGRDRLVNTAVPLLQSCCKLNPFVAEPHLLLAQILLGEGQYELAETEADEGVRLLLDWATNWDKRMTWEGWLAWGRVLRENAHEKSWPRSAFGVLSLGLVK